MRDFLPGVDRIIADAVDQRIEVEQLEWLFGIDAACQVQAFLDDVLRHREIVDKLAAQLLIRHFFQP